MQLLASQGRAKIAALEGNFVPFSDKLAIYKLDKQ